MDPASKQQALEAALTSELDGLQKQVLELARTVAIVAKDLGEHKAQTAKDLAELAGRIESNKPKVNVEVKTPEIKVDASKGLAMILNLFRRKK